MAMQCLLRGGAALGTGTWSGLYGYLGQLVTSSTLKELWWNTYALGDLVWSVGVHGRRAFLNLVWVQGHKIA